MEKNSPKIIYIYRSIGSHILSFFLIGWSVIIDHSLYSTHFNISNIWIDKNSTEVKIMVKNGELRYDTLIYTIWWIITLLNYWMYPTWQLPYWSILNIIRDSWISYLFYFFSSSSSASLIHFKFISWIQKKSHTSRLDLIVDIWMNKEQIRINLWKASLIPSQDNALPIVENIFKNHIRNISLFLHESSFSSINWFVSYFSSCLLRLHQWTGWSFEMKAFSFCIFGLLAQLFVNWLFGDLFE